VAVSGFPDIFVTTLIQLLDVLAASYGEQTAAWPTDPYLFLVWLHCGYPASEAKCEKGWDSLTSQIGVDAERILKANPTQLASALTPGGMVPELRAMRLKEIAERVLKQYGGDLRQGLSLLSVAQARGASQTISGHCRSGRGSNSAICGDFTCGSSLI
jgi:endonuclease III